jgi:small subunit ribosomal protein S18
MERDNDFNDNELNLDVSIDQEIEKMPRRFQRRRPRQLVPDYVDWKDVDFLRRFIPERGKIMPRRISGNCAIHQRMLATAIKRARSVAFIPFVAD